MGVPINNVTRRVVFAASGTGPYAFTFEILAASDIAVYRDDTLLTITTDYTVTINSNGTGSITLTASPTGATQIAIVGNRTIQRTTDFVTGGDFFANTLNDELDQQTIFAQQNAEGLARALQAPQTDPTTINMTLPRKADRAGKFLAFDAVTGDPVPGAVPPELASVNAIATDIVAVGTIASDVTAVANIDSDVSTVAGIASDVTSVAGISGDIATVISNAADITTVATDLNGTNTIGTVAAAAADIAILAPVAGDISAAAAIDAGDLSAVASISTDVQTVAGISTDVTAVAGISSDVTAVAADATDIGAVAGAIADVSTVAGVAADVATVAGIASDVSAVVADATDIGTVASDLTGSNTIGTVAGIATDVSTVAGIAADVSAVATDATDIGTVAANIADVSAVAAIDSDVSTVAANISDLSNFADLYLGPHATNPTTRNDSSSLVAGDLYFNTAVLEMRVWTGSAWVAATSSPDTVVEVAFTATAGQTSATFTGGYRIGFLYVFVNGVLLDAADITATNGTTVTFGTALTLNDEVRMITFKAAGSMVLSDIIDLTASAAEINVLDGITASTAELNILDGVTATASELNVLDGITASTTELNYVDGVTSAIQTQLDGKIATSAIGVSVQAYDSDLTTLGAGGSSARSFLGLAIGTDVQAYDANTAKTNATQTFTAAQTFNSGNLKLAGSSSGTGVLNAPAAASTYTWTLPAATDTLAAIGYAQTWTAAQTFRAANAIRSEAASTQDAVVIAGRAGGTGSYAVTITPTTLSANRTVTLADGNTTLVAGTTAVLGTAQSFSAAQRGTASSLTSSSASIASDFATANNFTHTFTENTTLANPSNLVAGQSGVIVFTQHASSPKTLAFGSYWKFPSGTVPSVTATNSAVDVLVYYVESTTRISARLIADVK